MVCAVLGCKVACVVGVVDRVMAERREVKWVCIKCTGLGPLAVCVSSSLGFLAREKGGDKGFRFKV